MEIKYFGHSCFRIKTKNATVVCDPFDKKQVGLDIPKLSAEVVTVSHGHGDHNFVERVSGNGEKENPVVIDRPGEYEISGLGVIGVKTYHDDKEGKERGENNVFVFSAEDVVVAHLGDLGHVLDDKQIQLIGSVDVLLVPVGGHFTIGPNEAMKVIDQLSPSIVIPMHYKAEGMVESFNELVTLDEFLEKSGIGKDVRREDKLSLNSSSLPEEMEVVVLTY